MLINEACKECKLTKKAIEYYGQQGLISPSLIENGYRQFSVADVEKLKKISTLRKLGLSVAEIGAVLKNEDLSTLDNIIHKKDAEIADLKAKQGLIQQLANTQNWEDIQEKLDILQSKQSILKRLREAFPGCYGKFFSSHFAAYLNEPIATAQQQEAYETIIRFLDTVSIEIPDDLKDFLDEVTMATDDNVLQKTQDNLAELLRNPEQYLKDNEEVLRQYQEFLESEEYKATPAFRLQELLKQLLETNGYNDIFIPAMKRLSTSYCKYLNSLEAANSAFLKKFPQD